MTERYVIYITPQTGRGPRYIAASFQLFSDACDFCRHKISFTGDRVRRVELQEADNEPRAMWDSTWDRVSQHAGLWS